MIHHTIKFFLDNPLVAWLGLGIFTAWGLATAPFDFGLDADLRDPVAVDAIPDLGENQQIIFTNWAGRSPQDIEDQISYPLTTALLGLPGVKNIRSSSMFGFSTIYVIFDEEVEFYWSRSRILEKLNSLPPGLLPAGVQPSLGPDATALGQIYWYTLEGRDSLGRPAGGWDLQELRSIQDFHVRYALASAEGVAEVASIGGYVKEYQVDVDPEAMRAHQVTMEMIAKAVRESNLDIGAQTMEINLAEYFVRGLGYVKNIDDIGASVVRVSGGTPIRVSDVARVSLGPAPRRGALDKSGAEAVGGVVVARYGSNPLEVIQAVKAQIEKLSPGLPSKTLSDGSISKVTIVPFYDRTELIQETIGTLEEALSLEIFITILVVLLMLFHLRSSILVSGMLPVAVLICFILMKYTGVDANIVALSGIAIAIGTMVDMGIILTESILRKREELGAEAGWTSVIQSAGDEVGSAVVTAVATTVVSFLPVFFMEAAEGKLFRPLAFTKTYALLASIFLVITLLPPLARSLFAMRSDRLAGSLLRFGLWIAGAAWLLSTGQAWFGGIALTLALVSLTAFLVKKGPLKQRRKQVDIAENILYALVVLYLLAQAWMPLGVNRSVTANFSFIALIAGSLIGFFTMIIHFYKNILWFLLNNKLLFFTTIALVLYSGYRVFERTGQEFMPSLDEGAFLLMPTAMPHAGMEENLKNLKLLDMAVSSIPEVRTVVGKLGRVESALDPAPISMYENMILYHPEYKTDEAGHRLRFRVDDAGAFVRDSLGRLVEDPRGRYYRNWRDHIRTPDDIWQEVVAAARLPGVTSAPKLQPIETRLVMLQTGMRAPMGIKVRGSELRKLEAFGLELERLLAEVPGVKAPAVFAERIIGKPYLLIDIDREAIARYGLTLEQVQRNIQAAVGGTALSQTVEGRERYSIRLRYPRELRSDPAALERIYLASQGGSQILLGHLAEIRYEQGPQSIKSEDGFLVSYVLFDREAGWAETEVVHNARELLNDKIRTGELAVPAGVSFDFAGNFEQHLRASKRLAVVIPVALALIFLILYFHFRSAALSLMVFSGVLVAFAGGFILIGWYGNPHFLDFDFFGKNMREIFHIREIYLSVAVWVGFLALFGIATDDGVLVGTFLQDSFRENQPTDIRGIREAVLDGGLKRVRPAMMTTATTLLALLPVMSSTGKGSDIMIPMAIPSFGGMLFQVLTMFTVPVMFSMWKEWLHSRKNKAL